ncbi:4-phosphoerythronate dehydrogenase [Arsenophonus symbiont of Ornithomya chloropus]|uniref:4-phosphoerythronate dehydrogenase n=1 Tax=Arsenophonus symbiont of Ornithomya chloropus TaxID=634121 RepID=UPI0032B13BBF
MKILIDENITYAKQLFQKIGEVKTIPGRLISKSIVKNFDALMVRSVTPVNETLLDNTNVKFVGTATSGFEHLDKKWLKKAGITFTTATGCNAISVVEYVFSALLTIAQDHCFDLREKTVGILGVGNIGNLLNKYLKIWGVHTLLYDPPLANITKNNKKFCSLKKIINEAEILTFHPALNKSKDYSSYHLLDEELLEAIPTGRILINTSRGSVFNNQILFNKLTNGKKIYIILDVWENEPFFLLPLLTYTTIATPHIAGYSLEGKIRGTLHIFNEFKKFLGKTKNETVIDLLPIAEFNQINFNGKLTQENLKRLIHLVYDIRRDDACLRNFAHIDGTFDHLRKYYPKRREWSSLTVNCDNKYTADILKMLGFTAKLIL